MTLDKKLTSYPIPWFTLAMTGIFLLSLMLRFWDLGKFNKLVFDEVYYAKFANNYLTGTPFFNSHPPLSQYIIAIGIWIASHFPASPDTVNNLTGSLRSTFSYRWFNALTGSFIPLVVGAIAYQLTHRRSYAVLAAIFAALDGFFLVESRYALNNIYLIIFGLLGQLYFLLALETSKRHWQKLTLSGIFFGASAAVKWNGLGLLLGIYLIWAISWVWLLIKKIDKKYSSGKERTRVIPTNNTKNYLSNLTKLNLLQIISYLGIIPLITYSLLWIPHLLINPQDGFWEIHQKILSFHQKLGTGAEIHPYCSPWYSWIFMWRPIAYYYETINNLNETIPTEPPLPPHEAKIIYDVHAIGNPVLWWLSAVAILLFLLLLIGDCLRIGLKKTLPTPQTWIIIYLVCNYATNLLPWIKVTRCTFIYHYIEALIFAELALAWIVFRCLESNTYLHRQTGITIILLIILAFIFWLPIYLGLPLSPKSYQLRMLFPNWI
ncbi:MAG: phospholipid carrier-dependent glycosyltransferase [Moorea sp. SIO2B7]|nr:phospholipid carrier-dependent glycosyltransferase [Moorena sp. SIO2B7]